MQLLYESKLQLADDMIATHQDFKVLIALNLIAIACLSWMQGKSPSEKSLRGALY
ncbi:hypothetical protein [Chroogloeocystis siderophila]|uniref:hypothetical protein n=1 Tax=Chroogloeocystis siderophila TaxID=329163 RepID=UPI0015C0C6D5|nr:hypothetical protein [Chroogloeocystis siderophila]